LLQPSDAPIPDRVLVLVRRAAHRGRHSDPPHRAWLQLTTPAGRFRGPLVVSMRPLQPADAIRAVQITSRLPAAHGAPVHVGFPESIGIADVAKPDCGDAVPIEPDERPVLWACGVTPQAAIAAARPPFAITHAPGCMLVSDLKNAQLAAM